MSSPPRHPDIRRQLKTRLLTLPPRAFELFAGDLLSYIGLHDITVTRYVGDGGIDAHGAIVTSSGLIRIPTGVQVKRHRQNIQRADIDRFIGVLSGQYAQGIFITTAQYAPQARVKASTSFPQITPIDGDQVLELMLHHELGLTKTTTPHLDENYFHMFEAQSQQGVPYVREHVGEYQTARPEDDLITLRTLSYDLRVDQTTIRRWIEQGKITPYTEVPNQSRSGFFFRRDQVDAIKRDVFVVARPGSHAEWRQQFLDFVNTRNLTKSYKPVLLKALLTLVNRNGEVRFDDLAQEFLSFYVHRQRAGLPPEFGVPLLSDPEHTDLTAIKRLIIRYPLDRFLLKGFLHYSPAEGMVHFTPQLWEELRFYELLDIQTSVDAQLRYYYERLA